MEQLNIEEHKREDDEKIFDLQQLVYPELSNYKDREKSRRYWQWRYFSNPDITSKVLVVKADGGKVIAGMRPISIISLHCNGAPLPCLMLTAVITHPDYRNKGIFSNLVQHSRQEAVRLGAAFAFTFPNEQSFAIYRKKSEWVHIGSIPLFAKILDCESILEAQCKPSFLTKTAGACGQAFFNMLVRSFAADPPATTTDITIAADIDDSYDRLWQRVAGDYPVIFKRDARYLQWRYRQNPNERYVIIEARDTRDRHLKGYIVVATQERFKLKLGLIVDILVESGDENTSALLISKALSVLKEQKAAVACCLMQKHYPYARALKKNGFMAIPQKISPKNFYFIGSALAKNNMPDTLFQFDKWYLTWGDTDNV